MARGVRDVHKLNAYLANAGGPVVDTVVTSTERSAPSAPANMIFISGGTFRMGSDRHYPEEAPVHRVTVDGFLIDRTPVTNRDFRKFVNETGYVTLAEIKPDAKDYPGALPHMLKAGHPTEARGRSP